MTKAIQFKNLFSRVAEKMNRDVESQAMSEEQIDRLKLHLDSDYMRLLGAGVREISERGRLLGADNSIVVGAAKPTEGADNPSQGGDELTTQLELEAQDAYRFILGLLERSFSQVVMQVAAAAIERKVRHDIASRINESSLWQSLVFMGESGFIQHPATEALRQGIRDWLMAEPYVASELSDSVQLSHIESESPLSEDLQLDLTDMRKAIASEVDIEDPWMIKRSKRMADEIGEDVELLKSQRQRDCDGESQTELTSGDSDNGNSAKVEVLNGIRRRLAAIPKLRDELKSQFEMLNCNDTESMATDIGTDTDSKSTPSTTSRLGQSLSAFEQAVAALEIAGAAIADLNAFKQTNPLIESDDELLPSWLGVMQDSATIQKAMIAIRESISSELIPVLFDPEYRIDASHEVNNRIDELSTRFAAIA